MLSVDGSSSDECNCVRSVLSLTFPKKFKKNYAFQNNYFITNVEDLFPVREKQTGLIQKLGRTRLRVNLNNIGEIPFISNNNE